MENEGQLIYKGLLCPYCHCLTELKDSADVYKGRHYGMVRICPLCGAYVNCYPGTERATGSVADSNLRYMRHLAHIWFDAIWKNKLKKSRYNAYSWLSLRLRLNKDFTHIGMADKDLCRRIIDISRQFIAEHSPELYRTMDEKYGNKL